MKIGLSGHFPTCIVLKDSFSQKHLTQALNSSFTSNYEQEKFVNKLMVVLWYVVDACDNIY